MTLAYILVLSIVQGLTEFLPVSSSAHLVLTPLVMEVQDQGLLIDVALHVGTLLAVLVYYWRDVWQMAVSVLFWRAGPMRNLALYIVLATVPALVFGLVIKHFFPEGIRSVAVITTTTLFFGILMGVADRFFSQEKQIGDITLKKALLIGCAQALAIIPGTSRSGATMTAARFMGFSRVDAARFSFLLGAPAIAAAGCMSFLEILKADDPGLWHDSLAAVFFAFIAGFCAIHFMMKWLTKFGLMPFVVYRMVLGAGLLYGLIFHPEIFVAATASTP